MSKSSQRADHAPHATHSPHPAAVDSSASPSVSPNRRRFLFALGAGGAGAAAVATRALAGPIAPAVATADAKGQQGYRETDHVRDYYATTRI